MPHEIKIAVQLQPQHGEWKTLRDAVVRAEDLGVDIVYNWDHFFPLSGDTSGMHLECWTMLGAWAEITQRVEIGALVTCNSYRNPELLADMARTVDHVSGGRLILGLGAGWYRKDYDEYGYEFGTAGDRLADLETALPRIERRLARLNPPPVHDIPILIGGGGERKTLRYTARHADVWHGFGDPGKIAHKSEVLDHWCAEEGTDPSKIARSVGVDPKRIELGDAYLDVGVTQFTLGYSGPAWSLDAVEDWVALRDERNAGGGR